MKYEFEYIEGIRASFEALDHNVPIIEIFIGDFIDLSKNSKIAKIKARAHKAKIKVKLVNKNELYRMSNRGSHQGIITKVKAYEYENLSNIIEGAKYKDKSLICILDHITDSGNLGAIARSAEAFGADGLIIANKRAAGITASTYKTSAGAICNLPIAKVSNINATLAELKNNRYWIAAASEHADKNIWEENLKGKIAIVMGSENSGVSSLVLKNSDFKIKLPLFGDTESLNVAQAFSACAYEWIRQNFS